VDLGVVRAGPKEDGLGFLHPRGPEGDDESRPDRAEILLRFSDGTGFEFAKWFGRPLELSFAHLDPEFKLDVRCPGRETKRFSPIEMIGTTREDPFVIELPRELPGP